MFYQREDKSTSLYSPTTSTRYIKFLVLNDDGDDDDNDDDDDGNGGDAVMIIVMIIAVICYWRMT